MNIYDVSERAGVSIATVSRVLNGNPNVSERTRKKVLAVMDELGYTHNGTPCHGNIVELFNRKENERDQYNIIHKLL